MGNRGNKSLATIASEAPLCSGTSQASGRQVPKLQQADQVDLSLIADCFGPLLLKIISYSASTPQEMAQACRVARSFSTEIAGSETLIWEGIYANRWPAFHECISFHARGQATDWRAACCNTLNGSFSCILEIFDREKKQGFCMAAMTAQVHYDGPKKSFMATYLSAAAVPPEAIAESESFRLRFCRQAVRDQLSERNEEIMFFKSESLPGHPGRARQDCYPYRVHTGNQSFAVGDAVELQWKMQEASPFGWWFGELEFVRSCTETGLTTATVLFKHFPSHTKWYRLQVVFGDAKIRLCDFGGYTGGFVRVDAAETSHWMRFFPKEPLAL